MYGDNTVEYGQPCWTWKSWQNVKTRLKIKDEDVTVLSASAQAAKDLAAWFTTAVRLESTAKATRVQKMGNWLAIVFDDVEDKSDGKADGNANDNADGIADGNADGNADGKAKGKAKGKAYRYGKANGKANGKADGKANMEPAKFTFTVPQTKTTVNISHRKHVSIFQTYCKQPVINGTDGLIAALSKAVTDLKLEVTWGAVKCE